VRACASEVWHFVYSSPDVPDANADEIHAEAYEARSQGARRSLVVVPCPHDAAHEAADSSPSWWQVDEAGFCHKRLMRNFGYTPKDTRVTAISRSAH